MVRAWSLYHRVAPPSSPHSAPPGVPSQWALAAHHHPPPPPPPPPPPAHAAGEGAAPEPRGPAKVGRGGSVSSRDPWRDVTARRVVSTGGHTLPPGESPSGRPWAAPPTPARRRIISGDRQRRRISTQLNGKRHRSQTTTQNGVHCSVRGPLSSVSQENYGFKRTASAHL